LVPGFDAVFYGWEPSNIKVPQFPADFRSRWPDGYLAIEHDIGHIPLGNGPADYAPLGLMRDYDAILSEFPNWPTTGDPVWQIIGRLSGPAYRRDPAQPPADDPTPPWYLR